MKDQSYKLDVPATPTGVMFHETPPCYQVEHFAIGLENPINDDSDIESLKSFFSASIMLKIPRFSCLLVKHPDGNHFWRTTQVNIDDHFIIRRLTDDGISTNSDGVEYEDLVNDYIAELATNPTMSTDKPLWEIHALVDVKCVVLRIHHAIGDGTSLAWLVQEIGSSEGGPWRRNEKAKTMRSSSKEHWRWSKGEGLSGLVRYAWFSAVFGLDSVVKLLVKDKATALKGKMVHSNYRQQNMATAKFSLDDVRLVKNAIPNATVNDVMCGIIWGGYIKYINARSTSGPGDGVTPKEGQQITGVIMVDVRKVSGLHVSSMLLEGSSFSRWWGNNIGSFFMPMHYTNKPESVLTYVTKSKSIIDKKKISAEPLFSFLFCKVLFRLFGVQVANSIIQKATTNATFLFSNVMGPLEQIFIAGNPVTYLKLSVSNLPLGIVMHLVSYMRDLNLQIMVAEEVIPDPKFLATCFQQTLHQMIDAISDASKV